MLWNNINKMLISVAIAGGMLISAQAGFAEQMSDDENISQYGMSSAMEKIEAEHRQKMQAIDNEYRQKLSPYSAESIELRKREADLKEARMLRRDVFEEELMNRKLGLSKSEEERLNPYVIKTKARNRFFESKGQ